jgi:probable HAF family extracellular repeat protein
LDLGTLPGNDPPTLPKSEAWAVNSRGQIVGWSGSDEFTGHATLFDPTGLGNNIDLNTVIRPDSGLELIRAYAINDNGWIVGDAMISDGSSHAFLLTPIPPPCQYALDGNINNDCKVDFFDFALLANQWFNNCDGSNRCNHADIDQSGKVDFGDLWAIGRNWLIDCGLSPDNAACVPLVIQ